MRVRDIVRRSGRSLRQAKARTLLTSLAIAVGAFTITLALAAGEGGRQYAENLVNANADERSISVSPAQNEQQTSGPREYSDEPSLSFGGGFSVKLISDSQLEEIRDIEGVESVTPYYSLDVMYVTAEGQKRYTADVQMQNPNITAEYLAGSGENLADDEVIMPESFREALGFNTDQDAIGKKIEFAVAKGSSQIPEVQTFEFTIAAVAKPSSFSLFASPMFEVNEAAAKKMYDYNREGTSQYGNYMAATAEVADVNDVAAVKERIESAGYTAETAEDAMGTLFEFINVLQGILIGFGALAVLTSVFGIINTQYISVLERTQQIGLMKALGMRRRDVGRLFKVEAAWIGFLGGLIGTLLAIGAGVLLNPWISDTLSLGEMHLLIFDPISGAIVVIGLMIVSVVSGILPARKASKLDPIEALRTE